MANEITYIMRLFLSCTVLGKTGNQKVRKVKFLAVDEACKAMF